MDDVISTTRAVVACPQDTPDPFLAWLLAWQVAVRNASGGALDLLFPDGMQDAQLALFLNAKVSAPLQSLVMRGAVCRPSTVADLLDQVLQPSWPTLRSIDVGSALLDVLQAWQLSNLCLFHGVQLRMDGPVGRLVSHPRLPAGCDGLQLWQRRDEGANQGGWVKSITAIELHDAALSLDSFVRYMEQIKSHVPHLRRMLWANGTPWHERHVRAVMALLSEQYALHDIGLDGLGLGALFAGDDGAYVLFEAFCEVLQGLSARTLSLQNNGFAPMHAFPLAGLMQGVLAVQLAGNPLSFLEKVALIAPAFVGMGGHPGRIPVRQLHDIKDDAMLEHDDAIFAAKMARLQQDRLLACDRIDFRAYVPYDAKHSARDLVAASGDLSVKNTRQLMQAVAQDTLANSERQHVLYRLYLSRAGLGDDQLRIIASVLRANAHVQRLDIAANPLVSMQGMLLIARALQANTHVQRLLIGGHDAFAKASTEDVACFLCGIIDSSALSHVDLSGATFTASSLKALIHAVLSNQHIETLNLAKANIVGEHAWVREGTVKTMLREIMAEDGTVIMSRLARIHCYDGHDICNVAAVLHPKSSGEPCAPGQQRLMPMLGLLSQFPVRIDFARFQALWRATVQGAEPFDIIMQRMVLGLSLAQPMPTDIDRVFVDDGSRQVTAVHFEHFCGALVASMRALLGQQVLLAPSTASAEADPAQRLRTAKAQLWHVMAQLKGYLQAHLGEEAVNSSDSDDDACYELLVAWVHGWMPRGITMPHTELGMTMVALVAEGPKLATQHALGQGQSLASVATPVYQYPQAKGAMPLTAKQFQHLIGFTAQQPSSEQRLVLKRCLQFVAVVLAAATVFAVLYAVAPLVLGLIPWLVGMGQVTQAAVCWGMVVGAVLCASGAVAGYQACRSGSTVSLGADGSNQVHHVRAGSQQATWRFFGARSQAQDPNHSPKKPDSHGRNELWAPAAVTAQQAMDGEDDGVDEGLADVMPPAFGAS